MEMMYGDQLTVIQQFLQYVIKNITWKTYRNSTGTLMIVSGFVKNI